MIIIEIAGGLGNQLQQYALYRKLESIGKEVKLDISWFSPQRQEKMPAKRQLELNYFEGLAYKICTPEEKKALTGSMGPLGKFRRKCLPFTIHKFIESQMYHPEIFTFEKMYVSGYFACEKYYVDILYDLRDKIRFPKSANPLNYEMAEKMKAHESVSVHLRRGDYLDPENVDMFGNICTNAYYRKAMEIIREKFPDAHFYLFSDDISYVEKSFSGEEYTIVNINHGKDSFYDMWLMSNCKHNICANSTFSFWGARLNRNENKIMIRPTIHKNSQVFVKKEMEELWPSWIFVDPKGQIG